MFVLYKIIGMEDINQIWNEVLDVLKEDISEPTFNTWFLPLVPHCFNEDKTEITLLTGQQFAIPLLSTKHKPEFQKAFKKVLNKDIEIRIIFDEDLSKTLKKKMKKLEEISQIEDKEEKKSKYENLMQMQSGSKLNLKYKFDNFVVGENNKYAHAAALAVAKAPGQKFNPLFIYGGSGLGKTHLMQAIGHYIIYNFPNLKIKYVKSEEFVNDLISSLQRGFETNDKMSKFRQKYRNIDVLLLDDIQFVAGKERTELEIFNTFEDLHSKGKQIVITSDKPPKELTGLSDRLKTRFEWGILADIKQPELEVRMAILKNLAKAENIELPFEVTEFVANLFSDNIRELEGAFNKLSVYATFGDLTLDKVKEIFNYNNKKIDFNTILEKVSDYFNISGKDILGTSRSQNISLPRQITIYLMKEILNTNSVSIADFLGKKHTTVLYSYDKIKQDMKNDKKLQSIINQLKVNINQ